MAPCGLGVRHSLGGLSSHWRGGLRPAAWDCGHVFLVPLSPAPGFFFFPGCGLPFRHSGWRAAIHVMYLVSYRFAPCGLRSHRWLGLPHPHWWFLPGAYLPPSMVRPPPPPVGRLTVQCRMWSGPVLSVELGAGHTCSLPSPFCLLLLALDGVDRPPLPGPFSVCPPPPRVMGYFPFSVVLARWCEPCLTVGPSRFPFSFRGCIPPWW